MTESKLPPVAWMYHGIRYDGTQNDSPSFVTRPEYMDAMSEKKGAKVVPLYASSPEVEQMRIEIERLRAELDVERERLKAAVTLLAEWCNAVDYGGASLDKWGMHYKKARWGLGILRSLIDAEIAKLKEDGR